MNKKLFWREYLRGLIDGQRIRLSKDYTLAELKAHYRRYIKFNPIVKKETR